MKNLENLKLKTSYIKWSEVDIAGGRKPTPVAYKQGVYQTTSNNLKASQTGSLQD